MASPDRQDVRLNSLLSELAQRAAGGDGAALVRRDELIGEDLDALLNAGLLEPCGPARETLCDGCERACVMPVEIRRTPKSDRSEAFIACDKRDDIGRVTIDPAALDQWRLTLAQLAAILGKALGTDQVPRPSRSGDAWLLGAFTRGKGSVDVVMRTDGGAASPDAGLIVTLAEPPPDTPAIAIARLLRFRNGALSVDRGAITRVLGRRFDDPRIACEIRYDAGSIVLVNHVTGGRRTIAAPHFNSSSDNAFGALYDNPGRAFTLQELHEAIRDHAIDDLHKLVENLNFEGPLKRLFFRVSKGAIRFERTATRGRLALLSIDPKALS